MDTWTNVRKYTNHLSFKIDLIKILNSFIVFPLTCNSLLSGHTHVFNQSINMDAIMHFNMMTYLDKVLTIIF